MADLNQRPIIELLGIVSASGSCGASDGAKGWIFTFTLHFWKQVAGPLRDQRLTIRKSVSEKELESAMKQVSAYDVVHIQARVAEENCFGSPQGLLVHFIRKDFFDAELKRCVSELRKPVTFKDSKFGVFTLDRRINWFEAQVPWESTTIRLQLSAGDGGDPKECLAVARALWDLQSVWSKRVKDLAIVNLLNLKNDGWLREDESALDDEQFRAKMQLESITVNPDGTFEFWYDDGDLFWGHSIRVSGNLSEGPSFAGIEG